MRFKRTLIAALVSFAVLSGSGAAAAGAAVSDEQVAITGPLPGTAGWHRDHSLGHTLPDPQSAEPSAVARFFAGLGAADQRRLAQKYPLVVGNLDGAPVQLRYQANRIALQQALTAPGTSAAQADEYQQLLRPGRQILAFDPRSRGQVAEVFGDLSTAQRVSVLVPGSDVDITHYEDAQQPTKEPAGMAQSLYQQETAAAPHTGTAVIAWADYTTPVGLGADAATSRLARAAVPRLMHLLSGLRATTHPVAPPALFCHSYGSVVCGLAAPEIHPQGSGGGITDMVVFGSPGMGVDDASDLGDGVRLWAARDPSDWISNVPYLEVEGLGHGADPTGRTFGSRVLSAARADGHTGYLAPGTDSLRDFADIGEGRYGDVICAATDPTCTAGLQAVVR
jgi:hypothetical protein